MSAATAAVAEPTLSITAGLSLKAADFTRLLGAASLFAGGDLTLPVLNSVRLTLSGSILTAHATDRYVLFRERITVENDEGHEWECIVGLNDLRTIRQMIACSTTSKATARTLTILLRTDGNQLRVMVGALSGHFDRHPEWNYPDVEKIIADHQPTDDDSPTPLDVGLNTAFVGKIARIGAGQPWRMVQKTANKPMFFTPIASDKDVLVGVMPVRIAS